MPSLSLRPPNSKKSGKQKRMKSLGKARVLDVPISAARFKYQTYRTFFQNLQKWRIRITRKSLLKACFISTTIKWCKIKQTLTNGFQFSSFHIISVAANTPLHLRQQADQGNQAQCSVRVHIGVQWALSGRSHTCRHLAWQHVWRCFTGNVFIRVLYFMFIHLSACAFVLTDCVSAG